MSKQIRIDKVERVTADGVVETLHLTPGVNVLQGPPNSGKTVWLNIIDYLMGDTGSIEEVLANEDANGNKLYEKYLSASMTITIDDKSIIIERRWAEPGSRSKVFIDGTAILAADFSDYLLTELEIPLLHFPKGNPYTDKAWPSLSWRMMLRHIFRQENYWSDLADRQPDSEQHAALTQFLGIAEKLFSQGFGDVINKRKQLVKLEAEKEQFSSILDNIGRSMSSPDDVISFLTNDTIQKSIQTLEAKISALLTRRDEIIKVEVEKIEKENNETQTFILQKTAQRESLIDSINQVLDRQKSLFSRIAEFRAIDSSIKQEVDKLNRTKEAGTIFADLKITHCPACDQSISQISSENSHNCFLCHQPINQAQAYNRLDFEIAQLSAEREEIQELVTSLKRDEDELNKQTNKLRYDLTLIERELTPLRNKMTAIVSPEIGELDTERGRYQEQIEAHKRILINLDYKNTLIEKIDTLNSEISALETQLDTQEEEINFEEVSSRIEDGMTFYLNEINKINPNRWPHKRPSFRIGERNFIIKVNEARWSKALGATSKLYFLFAYHYGLLSLTNNESCNYPGLLIIDFPPELPNTERDIAFTENYVVEPFIELCSKSNNTMQVIIAGNTFKNLNDVNSIDIKYI